MRRHILLPRLLRNQPLVTYIARRQTLATALGLRDVHSAPGDAPASRAAQPWWPLPADRLSRPARELVIDRSEEEALVSQPAGARQEFARPAVHSTRQEDLREPDVQREHTSEAQMALAEPKEIENVLQPGEPERDRIALQPDEPAQDVTDVSSRPLAESRSGGAEQASAQSSSLREKPEESVGRDPSRRRVRPSIAEVSTSNEKLPLISPAEESEPDTGQEWVLPATESASVEQSTSELITAEGQSGAAVAEELFAPRGTDRSPQAWLARLTRQAQRERQAAAPPAPVPRVRQTAAHMAEPIAPESPVPRMAEPVAQSARTFLKPLLGLDPVGVPIYRDRQAEDATAGERADALSDGEAIELAPGHSEGTPETLGLLAHELTHVARQQRPRFIPPILRWVAPTPAWETRDEEAVALQVEHQVRLIARGEQAVSAPVASHQAANEPVQSEAEEIAPRADRGIWGNLPAPWEPLPEWLAGPSVPGTQGVGIQLASPLADPQEAGMQPASNKRAGVPSAPKGGAGEDVGAEESGKRRAGVERGVEEPGSGETSPPQDNQPTSEQRAPEPDLDALARQVYSLLRRRLSVEQRREM